MGEFGKSCFAQELEAEGEIAGDFGGCVGIGGEGDGNFCFGGKAEEGGSGVGFGAGFVEACGVQFDRGADLGDGFDDRFVEAAEVAGGSVGELLDKVGVAKEVEKLGGGHFLVFAPVEGPDLFDITLGPASEPFWVIKVPIGSKVVEGADEVVPRVLLGKVIDPWFAVGEPIAFEAGADGKGGTGMLAGAVDPLVVGGEVFFEHAPVVEGFGRLWGVIGDAVFGELGGEGGIDVGFGRAFGVEAERGVGVIIGGHRRFVVVV